MPESRRNSLAPPARGHHGVLPATILGALIWVAPWPLQAGPVVPPATLAVEDTLPVPRIQLKEIEVRAQRQSLEEILDRIAAGEARRDSSIHDEVYDVYARLLEREPGKEAPRRTVLNQVSRVYRQQGGLLREVVLKRGASRADLEVSSGPSMREQIIKFAFDPALRKLYRFRISGRDFAGSHIVYRVEFEPRSNFYKLPTGRLWVDTNEFVILREEFWYRGASPMPLVFKALDNFVVERTQVDGKYWVISRILGRVTFTLPILGIPPQGDMVISHQNYRINQGIAPEIWKGIQPLKEGQD